MGQAREGKGREGNGLGFFESKSLDRVEYEEGRKVYAFRSPMARATRTDGWNGEKGVGFSK